MSNLETEETRNQYEVVPDTRESSRPFNVIRRVYQQERLNKDAHYQKPPSKTLNQTLKDVIRMYRFHDCIFNAFQIVRWLPQYQPKKYLVGDLVAGITVGVIHIPQGMAFAMLAEVPPIVGLYMAFFPVLVYVIFGTSPHVSIGTFAVACLMSGKVVTKFSTLSLANVNTTMLEEQQRTYEPVQVVGVVSFTVGLLQLLMWILRLGAVSTLLSEPLVSGITTAAAFQVLASQLKDLLGLQLPKAPKNCQVIITVINICRNIHHIHGPAVILSFLACLTIALNNELLKPWLSKKCRVPMPIEIITIVVCTLVSKYGLLYERFGIKIVRDIPTGLPVPVMPALELMPSIALDAITITMVTYTITMSMALIFANREKYEIDGNQELLALGASNVFASFFACAPICASLSRSFIQYQAGAKTGITSVISASVILCVLLWVGPFFEQLPRSVLASIIVVSLKAMFMQVKELKKFLYLSKLDAAVWLVAFLTTVIIDIDYGLYAGLLASVGALFARSQRPYTCLLGRVLNTDLYLDIKRYRATEEVPGIKIFHYNGGLNFATKNLFRSTFYHKIGYMKPHTKESGMLSIKTFEWDPTLSLRVHLVVIDAIALSYVDTTGIKTLVEVQKELEASDIKVILAGPNAPVLEMIQRYNNLHEDRLYLETYPTVHDAVMYYKATDGRTHKVTIVTPQEEQKLYKSTRK